LVVKVCSEHKLPLKVAGNGPLLEHLKSIAGESVQFLGRVSDQELAELYAGAKALIFPAIEDFGMIPVECMAAGTPVLGLNAGGSREIINGLHLNTDNQNIVNPTGILLNKSELTQRSLYLAILQISEAKFNPEDCVKQARLFSDQVFRDGWSEFFIKKLKKELAERGVIFDDSLINS
jgi:glycosyltransferase involved in cell wall biosynthesis